MPCYKVSHSFPSFGNQINIQTIYALRTKHIWFVVKTPMLQQRFSPLFLSIITVFILFYLLLSRRLFSVAIIFVLLSITNNYSRQPQQNTIKELLWQNHSFFLVGKERICQVTPILISISKIFTQRYSIRKREVSIAESHITEIEISFDCKGIALSTI